MSNPAAYAASKRGIFQLTRWTVTTASPKVCLNAISAGGIFKIKLGELVKVYEAITLLGRIVNEEDFCVAIANLTTDVSRYVTGVNIAICRGWGIW